MPALPLDRRFGIQLSNYQEPTTNWQTGNWQTGNVPAVLAEYFGMLCVVPMHVGTWPLFMTWGFSLCAPFYAHSMAFRAVFFLCFCVFYTPIIIICDPNRKCYSSMSGASADYLDTFSSSSTTSTASSSSTSTLTSASIEFSIGKARVQICASHSLECWTPSDFGHWPICIRKHKKESCRMKKKKLKKKKPERKKHQIHGRRHHDWPAARALHL